MATTRDPYAIIALGGKQYRVREGERLLVDRLKTDEGKTFHPDVLFLGGDGEGTLVPKTQVTAKVVGHVLGEKLRIGKRRPKSGYRKQTGFRAHLSQIEIQSIGGAAKRTATTAAATPVAEKEAAAPKPKAEPKATAAAAAPPAPEHPPRGYEDYTVADIAEKSKRWRLEQLEATLKFEKTNANRKGAIAALEAAIAAKQEKQ
jgi:ribosomal protein L21